MIPNEQIETELTFIIESSRTYSIEGGGMIDGLDALKQTVSFILQTERFEWPIYSWDYGLEVSDLYGQDMDYVELELESRIKEALMQDDRIEDVINFVHERKKDELHTTFTVVSRLGEWEESYDL